MQLSTILFATLLALPQSYAQQAPDGVLVPFTSALPPCATQCGPLYDVQGGCANQACFCADARLSAFRQSGTAGVSSVCGAASCTAAADLEKVKSWYTSFCGAATPAATTTSASAGASATAGSGTNSGSNTGNASNSSGGGGNDSWLARHTRWVIMIVIIVVGLILLWIGAWWFRRRYLRKKEKEIEMSPPVAWGPNQVHGPTGGYQYGDGIVDSSSRAAGGATGGGHHKEMAPAQGKRLSKAKMSWFKAGR